MGLCRLVLQLLRSIPFDFLQRGLLRITPGPQGGPTHPDPEGAWIWGEAPCCSMTLPLISFLLAGFFLFLWFCSQRCRSEAEAEAEMEVFTSSQMVQ